MNAKEFRDATNSLVKLLLKLVIVAAAAAVMFGYIFGLNRNVSQNMKPALKDGDLVFFYRMARNYAAGDVVYVRWKGDMLPLRVVAVAGDSVDISTDGLIINDAVVQEPEVIGITERFEGGVDFPLIVPDGHLYLMGDNRPLATDSRTFGCIAKDEISGKVEGVFRRRGF